MRRRLPLFPRPREGINRSECGEIVNHPSFRVGGWRGLRPVLSNRCARRTVWTQALQPTTMEVYLCLAVSSTTRPTRQTKHTTHNATFLHHSDVYHDGQATRGVIRCKPSTKNTPHSSTRFTRSSSINLLLCVWCYSRNAIRYTAGHRDGRIQYRKYASCRMARRARRQEPSFTIQKRKACQIPHDLINQSATAAGASTSNTLAP